AILSTLFLIKPVLHFLLVLVLQKAYTPRQLTNGSSGNGRTFHSLCDDGDVRPRRRPAQGRQTPHAIEHPAASKPNRPKTKGEELTVPSFNRAHRPVPIEADLKNQLFPVQKPRGNATMNLTELVGQAEVNAITQAGAIQFHATGDTGKGMNSQQDEVAQAMAR